MCPSEKRKALGMFADNRARESPSSLKVTKGKPKKDRGEQPEGIGNLEKNGDGLVSGTEWKVRNDLGLVIWLRLEGLRF